MLAEVNDTGVNRIRAFCCPVSMKSILYSNLSTLFPLCAFKVINVIGSLTNLAVSKVIQPYQCYLTDDHPGWPAPWCHTYVSLLPFYTLFLLVLYYCVVRKISET